MRKKVVFGACLGLAMLWGAPFEENNGGDRNWLTSSAKAQVLSDGRRTYRLNTMQRVQRRNTQALGRLMSRPPNGTLGRTLSRVRTFRNTMRGNYRDLTGQLSRDLNRFGGTRRGVRSGGRLVGGRGITRYGSRGRRLTSRNRRGMRGARPGFDCTRGGTGPNAVVC